MYELRGLPSTSVLFNAWGVFGGTLLKHGALARFRRVLMQPVLIHLDTTLHKFADEKAAVEQLVAVGAA